MIDPDAKVGLFTRLWDWLTYRPWTDEEIAEQVAKSVANTRYKKWHDRNVYAELPMDQFPPLTAEESVPEEPLQFIHERIIRK